MTSVTLAEAKREERVLKLRTVAKAAEPISDEVLKELKETWLPPGYKFESTVLTWTNLADDEKTPMVLAGRFTVLAETRDANGSSWGIYLHWTDRDGRDHLLPVPRASLAGGGLEAIRIFLSEGLYVAPSKKAQELFISFLLQVKSPARATATSRVGWHDCAFVLPDRCYGADERDMPLLQSATAHEHAFRTLGTMASWQENVAKYAPGNSRLVIAISAAFAGPLLGPCDAEGGGLHFRGASSTGKSTALHVAGSVWGGGPVSGYVRSWRATANGLEGVALGHSDTMLCLDELSQLASRDAGEAAYMLANGSGKSRSARDGSARRAAKWRLLFLSSGEIGLAEKVAEDNRGRKLAAGQQVRVVDIPADAGAGMGMFENLHDFATAEHLARHLRMATGQNYGVASREFLTVVVPDIAAVQSEVSKSMKAFCEQHVPAGADGQVARVAQRFALIAAGGEIATAAGILPWDAGEATTAAARCFADWLSSRGGIEPAEVRDGIEQVRSFISANGMARFIPAWAEDVSSIPIRDVAGFRRSVGDGWDFYVTSSAWKEVCAGFDPKRIAGALADKGLLLTPDAGPHRAKSMNVPQHGKQRLYHLPACLLEGE